MPATVRIAPSRASRELGERALDVAAQRALGAHQRVVAHVEAEHLLLEREPLALGELERRGSARRSSNTGAVVAGVAAEVEEAHRALRRARAGARSVASTIGSNTMQQALARVAERVERRPP